MGSHWLHPPVSCSCFPLFFLLFLSSVFDLCCEERGVLWPCFSSGRFRECRGIDQFCLRNKMQVQTAGMKDEASGLLIWSREGPV